MRITIFSLMLIVLGGLFVSQDITQRKLERAYESGGEWTMADSIDGYQQTIRENVRTHKITGSSYRADVSYTTKSGQHVTALQKSLPPAVIDLANNGGAIRIQYLTSDPTTMRFPNHEHQNEDTYVAFIVLILGIFLFYIARRGAKKSGK